MSVNCWKYARETYLVGRSVKFRPFTESERAAVIEFVLSMMESRPSYVPYIRLKKDNPLDPTEDFKFQNDYALGKMVQRIGRSLKVLFCKDEEKDACDALFAATDPRRRQAYNGYVADQSESESASQSESESASQSESEPEEVQEISDSVSGS